MANTRRNIGVRSGIPTRTPATTNLPPAVSGDASLHELFTSLQLNITDQMQEHWRSELARRREKDAEDRRTRAVFEARMMNMEEQMKGAV